MEKYYFMLLSFLAVAFCGGCHAYYGVEGGVYSQPAPYYYDAPCPEEYICYGGKCHTNPEFMACWKAKNSYHPYSYYSGSYYSSNWYPTYHGSKASYKKGYHDGKKAAKVTAKKKKKKKKKW